VATTELVDRPSDRDDLLRDVLAVSRHARMFGGAVEHLLGRRDAGRREQHEETDLRRAGRSERRDPRSLAEAPQTDALGVDVGPRCELVHDAHRVLDLQIERHVITAAVEARHGDAARRQRRSQMPEEEVVLRPIARAVERDDRRMWPGARG
jgi:hypothetical protein